jgi:hypothetical protein
MTKRKLKKALRETETVRDAWCAEYAKARKLIRRLERKISS